VGRGDQGPSDLRITASDPLHHRSKAPGSPQVTPSSRPAGLILSPTRPCRRGQGAHPQQVRHRHRTVRAIIAAFGQRRGGPRISGNAEPCSQDEGPASSADRHGWLRRPRAVTCGYLSASGGRSWVRRAMRKCIRRKPARNCLPVWETPGECEPSGALRFPGCVCAIC